VVFVLGNMRPAVPKTINNRSSLGRDRVGKITQSVLDVRPMLHRLPEQGIEQLLLLSFGRAVHALPVIRYTEARPMPSCLAMKEATPNSGEGCPLALRTL